MTRILLTGISGVGKSTLIEALAVRGERAVDLDGDEYSEWVEVGDDDATPGSPVEPDCDWAWRADRVADLLGRDKDGVLFVSGCAANMGQFLDSFDRVILLSAPEAVITHRLATRSTNQYGKTTEQAARVLDLKRTVEPLLRRTADREIDTDRPLDEVLARVTGVARDAVG